MNLHQRPSGTVRVPTCSPTIRIDLPDLASEQQPQQNSTRRKATLGIANVASRSTQGKHCELYWATNSKQNSSIRSVKAPNTAGQQKLASGPEVILGFFAKLCCSTACLWNLSAPHTALAAHCWEVKRTPVSSQGCPPPSEPSRDSS